MAKRIVDEAGREVTHLVHSILPKGTYVLAAGVSRQIGWLNPKRQYIIITNHGANPAAITMLAPAVAGEGIYCAPNGGWVSFNRFAEDWRGELFAISTAGTTLGILEV